MKKSKKSAASTAAGTKGSGVARGKAAAEGRRRAHSNENKTAKGWSWLSDLSWLLLLTLPALTFSSTARETFRLPKLLISELLVLVSLVFLATRLWNVARLDGRSLLRHPAVQLMLPLLLVASLTWFSSDHRQHVAQGLLSLSIAGVGLMAWSLGWRPRELSKGLQLLVVPALLLSLLGLAQHYHLLELFQFRGDLQGRIALTSLAGGAFDLAAYLVLPGLVAQWALWRADTLWQRLAWLAVLALLVYVIALTRTLSAIAGLLLASAVLWALLLPRRQLWRLAGGLAVASVAALLLVAPLQVRLNHKIEQAKQGNYNQLLNGRLDGWRTALWMLEEHPILGVGHGAYRAEFGHAKLALRQAGVPFFRKQHQPYFVNAHNEVLEAAAEWGIVGLAALLWGLGVLWRQLRRRRWALAPDDAAGGAELALMWGGVAALAVMSMGNFPLRLALVAYPFVLLLAWILQPVHLSEVPSAEADP